MSKKLAYLAALVLALGACRQQQPQQASPQSEPALSPTPPVVQTADQPGDEFGLKFVFTGASEDLGNSSDAAVTPLKRGNSSIYGIRHMSGCGYYPASPRYELVGDTLQLSYILQTDMDALPASPCVYTSEFRFSHDPGADKVVFNVRE